LSKSLSFVHMVTSDYDILWCWTELINIDSANTAFDMLSAAEESSWRQQTCPGSRMLSICHSWGRSLPGTSSLPRLHPWDTSLCIWQVSGKNSDLLLCIVISSIHFDLFYIPSGIGVCFVLF